MKRILIVDDEPAVVELLEEIIDTYGLTPLTASSAREAVSLLTKERVDMILLDLSMPEITGEQFLDFIQKKGANIPVVVVSANVDDEREESLKEAGAKGFIRKPFEVGQVIDEIERLLGK